MGKRRSQKEKVVSDRRGPGKKVVMIMAGGKIWKWGNILEIREMHGDEGQGMLRDLGQ